MVNYKAVYSLSTVNLLYMIQGCVHYCDLSEGPFLCVLCLSRDPGFLEEVSSVPRNVAR